MTQGFVAPRQIILGDGDVVKELAEILIALGVSGALMYQGHLLESPDDNQEILTTSAIVKFIGVVSMSLSVSALGYWAVTS